MEPNHEHQDHLIGQIGNGERAAAGVSGSGVEAGNEQDCAEQRQAKTAKTGPSRRIGGQRINYEDHRDVCEQWWGAKGSLR